MKIAGTLITVLVLLAACTGRKGPDVSKIDIKLEQVRFEKDFFALDTNNLPAGLQALSAKHPQFLQDYLINILGLPPQPDSSGNYFKAIKAFLHDYRPVLDSASRQFEAMDKPVEEIRQGLRYVKYYFPQYKTPTTFITYIGPMDAYFEASTAGYSDVLTNAGLASGLQLHMGADFSMYKSEMGLALYPAYISRRFSPQTISVNAIRNIIDDLYPEQLRGLPLVDQMVEKGKRLYLLDLFMPETADTLKLGYTAAQLKGCEANEGRIWNFFTMNNLLLNTDPAVVKSYLSEGPQTQELGDGSPGYIGLYTGWQIVKAYMDKNPDLKPEDLLRTNPRKIYEGAKYRPK